MTPVHEKGQWGNCQTSRTILGFSFQFSANLQFLALPMVGFAAHPLSHPGRVGGGKFALLPTLRPRAAAGPTSRPRASQSTQLGKAKAGGALPGPNGFLPPKPLNLKKTKTPTELFSQVETEGTMSGANCVQIKQTRGGGGS